MRKPCCSGRRGWVFWFSFATGGMHECRDCGAMVHCFDIVFHREYPTPERAA